MQQQLATRTGALQGTPQLDYVLLDGSGSMMGESWWNALSAIDAYIDTVRQQQVQSHCILHIFDDTQMEYIARDCSIQDWKSFATDPVGAHWGGTPLYDAINLLGRNLRDADPKRASIVIVTDGLESDSKYTSLEQARAIIDWMRAKGWQVTFLGAGFDNSRLAGSLGLDSAAAIGVSKENLKPAIKALASKRARYAHTGEPMHYTKDEQQKFGGYLGHG